jgi:phosphatidylglycerophosphatase C
MSLVFFDFDGTLTTKDTVWPFASFLSANAGRRRGDLASILLLLLKLKLHLTSNHVFKEQFMRRLVQGESESRIESLTKHFHETQLEPILNRAVIRSLLGHIERGDDVYLVSSNFDFFLRPLQERWKVKGIFATQSEVREGHFTGRILGQACDGKEKLDRVIACFGERRTREAVAYGDSQSDLFLLDFVRTKHWVGPSRRPTMLPPLGHA